MKYFLNHCSNFLKSTATCTPDTTTCNRSHLFPLFILFILLLLIYSNSFSGTWIFDDEPNIQNNPHIQIQTLTIESIKSTFNSIRGKPFDRPLAYLSFGLNYYFHGLDTWGYHLVNFAIHCLCAFFIYLLIYQTLHLPKLRENYAGQAGSTALLAATLWASSPVMVTSVTYIVQRMASMATLFFVMAMFFYLIARISPGRAKQIICFSMCIFFGLLSLATKENAVMLPVVLYLFDILLIQGISRQKLLRHFLMALVPIFFFIVIAFAFTNPLTILSGYDNREFTLFERLLTQSRILIFYLSLILYPIVDRFTLIYEVKLSTSLFYPWTTLPSILFWGAWVSLGIYLSKKQPLIAFCLLFFAINHIVESTIVPLELIYEHRNYLPSIGIYLLISIGIINAFFYLRKKIVIYSLFAILISTFIVVQGHSVILRNQLFAHPLYLWSDNVEKSPGLSRVHINLGRVYQDLGMNREARESYFDALVVDRYHRHSLKAVPWLNLANLVLIDSDTKKAIMMYQNALSINPKQWEARHGMTSALLYDGNVDAARTFIEQSIKLYPEMQLFQELYLRVLLRQKEYELVIEEAKELVSYSNIITIKVMGEAHRRSGNHDQAINVWQDFLRRNPNDLEAHLSLVDLGSRTGRNEVLIPSAVRLLSLKGGQTWEELFSTLPKYKSELVFTDDPMNLLPAVRQGVDLAMQ